MKKGIRIVKTIGKRELTLVYNRVPITTVSYDEEKGRWAFDAKFRRLLKKYKVETDVGYRKRKTVHEIVDMLNTTGILEKEMERRTAKVAPRGGKG